MIDSLRSLSKATRVNILSCFGVLLAAVGISYFAIGQTTPATNPLVSLATEPLYLNATKTKPTLVLSLSVEYPTVGAAYRDQFTVTKPYIGYFDNSACYKYNNTQTRFVRSGNATSMTCGGTNGFSGNFLNWATTSSIDIIRIGLTGGDRITDTTSDTTLQRAVLPDFFFNSSSVFPSKTISSTITALVMPTNVSGATSTVFIANCLNYVYFGTGTGSGTSCLSPGVNRSYGVSTATSSVELATSGTFYTRVGVCDSTEGPLRDLCKSYPNGGSPIYKPVGNLQKNSDKLRVAAFGYLYDNNNAPFRYGGVLRAPMKYVGAKQFDNNYNLLATANPKAEWSETTGIFVENPESASEGVSGVTNYLNRFGRLDPANFGTYKSYDPMGELYYEGVRYLQGLQPTTQAVSSLTTAMRAGFPVYTTWTDPHPALATTTDYSCLRNNILQIGDKNTHRDKSIPGSSNWTDSVGNVYTEDFKITASPSSSPPIPDFYYWTKVVGGFESNNSVSYVDSQGITRSTNVNNNATVNAARWGMENQLTGSGSTAAYFMAGISYWANTQNIRGDRPGMRARTFVIDVNEGGASSNQNTRRNTQLFLTAKYGGFDDRNKDGSPFSGTSASPDNTKWENPKAEGEAKNYFLASDAQAVLDALDEIFIKLTEETGSVAGGAVASQRIQAGAANATYQASFDAKQWGGSLKKYALTLDANGNPIVASGETWDAGDLLKSRTDGTTTVGADTRKIFVGNIDKTTSAASLFSWSSIQNQIKAVLNVNPANGSTDALGSDRLNYLKGFRGQESPSGVFRSRNEVLGDIVNSGIIYTGSPTAGITGDGYNSFFTANKNRPAAIYVGANDGMLHAFSDTDGSELFAYIPSFIASKLNQLTKPGYTHQAYVDATPGVAEAKVGSDWKTVLVSGVGGGAQGVFALDVTNPSTFTSTNALWEFTDSDDPNLGFVIGQPRIVKLRTSAKTATVATYGWYAMFGSGVNSHANDANFNSSGKPAIFILDLAKSYNSNWSLNSNYWRIDLPQSSTTRTFGLAEISEPILGPAGEARTFYAGDLQANVWKLDFSNAASADWNATGLVANRDNSNSPSPFYIAKDASGVIQPITTELAAAYAFGSSYFVLFGTGKFIEPTDIASTYQAQSFYALLDDGQHRPTGRSGLQEVVSTSSYGVSPTAPFQYGYGTGKKQGWYFDYFNSTSTGERQISDIRLAGDGRTLFFGSVFPATEGCGIGGGYIYAVDMFTANGTGTISNVGILSAPILLELGVSDTRVSDSQGKRETTRRTGVLTQGSRGIKFLSSGTRDIASLTGVIYWRQIHNYEELKK